MQLISQVQVIVYMKITITAEERVFIINLKKQLFTDYKLNYEIIHKSIASRHFVKNQDSNRVFICIM